MLLEGRAIWPGSRHRIDTQPGEHLARRPANE
jgi:hypothetical protein